MLKLELSATDEAAELTLPSRHDRLRFDESPSRELTLRSGVLTGEGITSLSAVWGDKQFDSRPDLVSAAGVLDKITLL